MWLLLGCLQGGSDDSAAPAPDTGSGAAPVVSVEVPEWPDCPGLTEPFAIASAAEAWVAFQERTPDIVAVVASLASADAASDGVCPEWTEDADPQTISGDCTTTDGVEFGGMAQAWMDEEQFKFLAEDFSLVDAADEYSFRADGAWRSGPAGEGYEVWATGSTATAVGAAYAAEGIAHGGREDDGGFFCARGECTEVGRVRMTGLWSAVAGAELTGEFCYAAASEGDEWPFTPEGEGVVRLVGATRAGAVGRGGCRWARATGRRLRRRRRVRVRVRVRVSEVGSRTLNVDSPRRLPALSVIQPHFRAQPIQTPPP